MNNVKIVVDKKNWRFWLPFSFGVFVLINSIIWIILNGGRWFEEIDPSIGQKPEYYNNLNRVFGPFYMLGYFTVQTNIFVGIMLVIFSFFSYKQKTQSWFMGSVMLITITFLVFWLILAPGYDLFRWESPYFTISNVFLHGINPICGFIVLFLIREEIVIHKRILGICSLWMAIFYIFNAIFYGVSSTIDNSTNDINGSAIYSFLDLRRLFFVDFANMPVLGIFLNIILFIAAPFLPILISVIWIAFFKIQSLNESYFNWMDKIKNKIEARNKGK